MRFARLMGRLPNSEPLLVPLPQPMATLTREAKPDASAQRNRYNEELEDLTGSVPTPFPEVTLKVEVPIPLQNSQLQQENKHAETTETTKAAVKSTDSQAETSQVRLDPQAEERTSTLLPSIIQVERSCLITLNALLSNALPNFQWTPILPLRRHSMPNTPLAHTQMESDTSHLLEALLENLRILAGDDGMTEINRNGSLLHELQSRVDHLVETLDESDAQLAKSLVALLIHAERLTELQPRLLQAPNSNPIADPWDFSSSIYDTLDRQVSHLKARRADEDTSGEGSAASREQRELMFLWAKIDENLEAVQRLCRRRITDTDPFRDDFRYSHDVVRASSPSLPPEYDPADFELPQYRSSYEFPAQTEKDREKRQKSMSKDDASVMSAQQRLTTATASDEKMRLDLEAVTRAIDRLYLVAPQLHNQRVELKADKMEEMKRAASSSNKLASSNAGTSSANKAQRSRSGSSAEGPTDLKHATAGSKGKGKVAEYDDLENMLSLIGKASSRRMNDQAVVLSDGMKTKLQRARLQDDENRRKFVEQLVSHSDAGRLHDQDAVLPSGPRIKDPEGMLTLPEFIREAVPTEVQQRTVLSDPNAMLTLPEFVKESQRYLEPKSQPIVETKSYPQPSSSSRGKKEATAPTTKRRSKSFSSASAAGAWIIGKSWNRHLPPSPALQATSSTQGISPAQAGLHISFVAEYQETLNVVILLFKVNGELTLANQLVVEVVPSTTDGPPSGDRLLIKCGASCSPPLPLPTRVLLGKHTVPLMGEHYEIKLATPPSLSPPQISTSSLLDASHLISLKPSAFVCSSCSLPLAQITQPSSQESTESDPTEDSLTFRDLPSEYWTELVDAWVCHPDQKLSARIAQKAQDGFWPKKGECLVGGSYVLLDESSMIVSNLRQTDLSSLDGWTKVHCLCGASVGRVQRSPVTGRVVYRLPKFAIRPISTDSRPIRIPMSAYIVEDMVELSQAHGAYRFVICDEEEEKPRLLVWIFKPSMKLSYSTSTAALIPRSGSIVAAKILFKVIGPGGSSAGFDVKS
ncbi:hypothetical protein FRC16_001788, partial [Serendipita sp. 398]